MIAVRASRTCHTKWGARHVAETCFVITTGSALAASYSAAECWLPVSGLRVRMRSST